MTDHHHADDPPRLALRVRMPAGTGDATGDARHLDHWRDVWPNDSGYDAAYRRAVHAYRVAGTPMPYADASDRSDAKGEG